MQAASRAIYRKHHLRTLLLNVCALEQKCAAAASTLSARAVLSSAARARTAPASAIFSGDGARSRLVLGIESSCDDTAAAVVASDGTILGEAIAGQVEVHAPWGGVVPNLAREAHEAAIDRVVSDALSQAGVSARQLDAVAVTVGPGLSLCLRVGVLKAREVASLNDLKLVPVHHMEAHALVARLGRQSDVQFPFMCLLISGGHNLLLLVRGVGDYMQLGTTMDDAAGEAFDKVARMLGLTTETWGGAALEAFAREGDPVAFPFTVPMKMKSKTCDFSFSGLKSSVLMALQEHVGDDLGPATRQTRANIAASFQAVAVEQIEHRVRRAIGWVREVEPSVTSMVVSGGVASNALVRARLDALATEHGLAAVYPPVRLCTDNGVMVAWAGIERLALGIWEAPPAHPQPLEGEWVDLRPRWPLTDDYHPKAGHTPAKRLAIQKPRYESLTSLTRRGAHGTSVHADMQTSAASKPDAECGALR